VSDIVFRFIKGQRIKAHEGEGQRYRPARILYRVPCEPAVLYRIQYDLDGREAWAGEGSMRAVD
jgi:hypothetical protein